MADRQYSAGTIFLDVVPSFHNLQRRAEREGGVIGAAYARGVKPGLGKMVEDMEDAGEEGGEKAGSAFARAMATRIKAAQAALGKVKLDVDTTGAEGEIAKIAAKLKALKEFSIDPEVNGREAIAQARILEKQLDRILRDQTLDISARVNLGAVRQELAELQRQIGALSGPTKAQMAQAAQAHKQYTEDVKAQERALNSARRAEYDLDRNMAKASLDAKARQHKAALDDYIGRERRARDAVARLAMQRDTAALQQTEAETRARRTGSTEDFTAAEDSLARRYLLEQRLAKATAEERAAAAARGAFAETASHQRAESAAKDHYDGEQRAAKVAAAERVALARLTAMQERAAQSSSRNTFRDLLAQNTGQAANSFRIFNGYLLTAVTLGPLLIPILASIAAGMAAVGVATIAAVAGVGALVLGLAGIGGAVTALANLDRERRRQSSGSKAPSATDTRGLEQAQIQLARAREDAGRRIAAAARQQENAERSLTKAVKEAADANRDLMDARRQAAEDLEDLNNRLASGLLSERQASFALQEASFRYNNVLEDDQATQREKDIARLDFEQAQQQFRELQTSNRRLEREVAEANKSGVEGSDLVVDAKQRIIDANQGVVDAERDLADAQADVARARVEEARTIADAERGVSYAMQDLQAKTVEAGVEGSAAMDALREAMLGLSPAGQAFAEFLYGLKPLLDELRGAAQEGLLPGLQSGIQRIVDTYGDDLVDFVGSISGVLGTLIDSMAKALTSPFWVKFFKTMADLAPGFLESFGKIAEGLSELIAGVLLAFAPYAGEFFDALVGMVQALAEWGRNLAGSEGFQSFIEYVQRVGPKVLDLFLVIAEVLIKAMIGLAPYVDKIVDGLLGFFEWLNQMDPDDLGKLALGILAIVGALQALSGLVAIISSFTGLFSGIAGVVSVLGGLGGAGAAGGATAAGGAAAASGPIGWIVGAVAAAIAAIVGLVWWLKHLYDTNETFRDGVNKAWLSISNAITGAWENFILPVLSAISTAYERFIEPFLQAAFENISDTWNLIGGVFDVGRQVVEKAMDAIYQIITFVVAPALRAWYDEHIKPTWEKYIQPIFDTIGGFLEDTVAPAWQRGLDQLGKIWDGIREMFAAPIRWVIETVINNGIIGAFNELASRVPGMTAISPVKIPQGLYPGKDDSFAEGGILPGYTPGRDVHTFWSPTAGRLHLSGGEGILVPELTRRLGRRWIAGANATARAGGDLSPFLGGFADGGIVSNFAEAVSGAVGAATDAISGATSALTSFLGDPAGALRSMVNALFSVLPGGEMSIMQAVKAIPLALVDGLSGLLGFGGDKGKDSGAPMSYQWMTAALRSAFPGIAITSTYRPGAVTATGKPSYHATGRAVDMTPSMPIFNWILSNYAKSAELLFSPAGARQILRRGVQGDTSGVTRAMHFNHVHWAYKDGGVIPNLYDNGGYLPPGLSLVANKTGKPEPILTDRQWEALSKRSKDDRGAGVNVQIMGDVVGDERYADRIADKIEVRRRDAMTMQDLRGVEVNL